MPHEAGNLSVRPEGDSQSALESAARHLGAPSSPGGGIARGGREILRRRQERELFAWARAKSRLIDLAARLPDLRSGGEEHRVSTTGDLSRYWKATHPGRYGFAIRCGEETGHLPELVRAQPLEYLQRLQLQNSVFTDDIRLEGVALERERLVIRTSPETVLGS